jgi:type IV pilus assembly protein PilA
MKPQLIVAHLTSQREKQRSSEGFTFIELLVVIIILGIISIMALPILLGQVGKARETEAKEQLSAIAQAQQAYFFEKGTFADALAKLDVTVEGKYYNFPNPITANSNKVKHQAVAQNAANNATRNYGLGIYYNSFGGFSIVLCQSTSIGGTALAPDVSTDTCSSGILVE